MAISALLGGFSSEQAAFPSRLAAPGVAPTSDQTGRDRGDGGEERGRRERGRAAVETGPERTCPRGAFHLLDKVA